jgi:DNA-binding NarL/FixJ family response regulator
MVNRRKAVPPAINRHGPASVLVVDDFKPFRSLVSSLLQNKPELKIVAEVADGVEAVRKAKELHPDLILLDIGLPKLNGIAAARQIREAAPSSKILFLSQETSADVVEEAISLGASGYVAKAKAGTDLLRAIEEVLLGKRFIGSGLSGGDHSHASGEGV